MKYNVRTFRSPLKLKMRTRIRHAWWLLRLGKEGRRVYGEVCAEVDREFFYGIRGTDEGY